MSIVVTLWWLSFWTALGLCVGSFLNAVIYRLPRHGSLRIPRWSACPNCQHRIAWHDNLPILSFVLLRGKCRHCGLPIATRYLVIEAGMAIVVLVLLDAFFIAHTRAGLSQTAFGITDALSLDWPIFAAHVILFACLLSMSAIDLEHYWVDIRFTNLATAAGFILHTLWTPQHSKEWLRPSDTTAFVAISALVGLVLVWIILVCQPHQDESDEATGQRSHEATKPREPRTSVRAESRTEFEPQVSEPCSPVDTPVLMDRPDGSAPIVVSSRAFGWLAGVILAALFVASFLAARQQPSVSAVLRGLVPLAFFFLLIFRESTISRASDQEIIAAIEHERSSARKVALQEFLLLVPAGLFAAAALLIMLRYDAASTRVGEIIHTKFHVHSLTMMRGWSPLWGFATAAAGYVIAGALGWAVRIVFTLVFGKEAFGTGDIHLMAAAGCVAGWPVAVLGFFLATGLAMLGWLLALPFKRPRALPLGPWLSLAFLAVVIFQDRLLVWPPIANVVGAVNFVIAMPKMSH